MFRRHAIVLVAVPLIFVLAGCSDDQKATPQVIFDGHIEHGTNDSNTCRENGPLFTVGDFGNTAATPPVPSTPIQDGQAFSQGSVSVGCSVTAAGADQFNVDATVRLTGATGGLFHVDGVFKTTGDQANIHAIFGSQLSANTYEETDKQCTVRYTNPFAGVAAGRVWGEITCPHAANDKAQTACQGVADFRFENCSQ
jgi:hypothetical protein